MVDEEKAGRVDLSPICRGEKDMRAMISTDMKQLNRKIVFDIVRKKRSVTRVELSEMTGMSGPSIMAIVNEFIDKGILTVTGKKNGSVGRSPVTMIFNPDVQLSIGIEFEGNTLSAGLVNLDGEIRFQTMAKVPSNLGNSFFEALCKSIDKLVGILEKEGLHYSGIGFGIPGVVDPEKKIVHFAPYIGVLESIDISEQIDMLTKRYQKPVFIENDVNASAIGEYYVRQIHEDIDDILFISIGAGIGAGIILDGGLRRGSRGMCGEIGYSLKDADSVVSQTQTGWLEKHISYETLCQKFPEYKNNGTVTQEMTEYITGILSPVIANLVNTLDISQVVLGGELLVDGGNSLLEAIRRTVDKLALSEVMVRGCTTEYTGVVGSALMASDKLGNTIL